VGARVVDREEGSIDIKDSDFPSLHLSHMPFAWRQISYPNHPEIFGHHALL
jgi:hypothetical protein